MSNSQSSKLSGAVTNLANKFGIRGHVKLLGGECSEDSFAPTSATDTPFLMGLEFEMLHLCFWTHIVYESLSKRTLESV